MKHISKIFLIITAVIVATLGFFLSETKAEATSNDVFKSAYVHNYEILNFSISDYTDYSCGNYGEEVSWNNENQARFRILNKKGQLVVAEKVTNDDISNILNNKYESILNNPTVLDDLKLSKDNSPSTDPEGNAFGTSFTNGSEQYWNGSEWTAENTFYSSSGCYVAKATNGIYELVWDEKGSAVSGIAYNDDYWLVVASDDEQTSGSTYTYEDDCNNIEDRLRLDIKSNNETEIPLDKAIQNIDYGEYSYLRLKVYEDGNINKNFGVIPRYTVTNSTGKYWNDSNNKWVDDYTEISMANGDYWPIIPTLKGDEISVKEVQKPYSYQNVGLNYPSISETKTAKMDSDAEITYGYISYSTLTVKTNATSEAIYTLTNSKGQYAYVKKDSAKQDFSDENTDVYYIGWSDDYKEIKLTNSDSYNISLQTESTNHLTTAIAIEPDTYTLKEISAPSGYQALKYEETFTVTETKHAFDLGTIEYTKIPSLTLSIKDTTDSNTSIYGTYNIRNVDTNQYYVSYYDSSLSKYINFFADDTPMEQTDAPTLNPLGEPIATIYDSSQGYTSYYWNGAEWVTEAFYSSTGCYRGNWSAKWEQIDGSWKSVGYYFSYYWNSSQSYVNLASLYTQTLSEIQPGNYELIEVTKPSFATIGNYGDSDYKSWQQTYISAGTIPFTVISGEDKTLFLNYDRAKEINITLEDTSDSIVTPLNAGIKVSNSKGQYAIRSTNGEIKFVDIKKINSTKEDSLELVTNYANENGIEIVDSIPDGWFSKGSAKFWNGTEFSDEEICIAESGGWISCYYDNGNFEEKQIAMWVDSKTIQSYIDNKVTLYITTIAIPSTDDEYTICPVVAPVYYKDVNGNFVAQKYENGDTQYITVVGSDTQTSYPVTLSYTRISPVLPNTGTSDGMILTLIGCVALIMVTIYETKKKLN